MWKNEIHSLCGVVRQLLSHDDMHRILNSTNQKQLTLIRLRNTSVMLRKHLTCNPYCNSIATKLSYLVHSTNGCNFAQLFRQHFKRFRNECQLPSRYWNWVFKVSASCSNAKSKSLSKSQGCLISELLWQIIPYWSKAVFSSAMLVGFSVYSIPVSHTHDNPVDWDLAT